MWGRRVAGGTLTGNKQGTRHHENPVIYDHAGILLALPNVIFWHLAREENQRV
jgi:hypothetical protein